MRNEFAIPDRLLTGEQVQCQPVLYPGTTRGGELPGWLVRLLIYVSPPLRRFTCRTFVIFPHRGHLLLRISIPSRTELPLSGLSMSATLWLMRLTLPLIQSRRGEVPQSSRNQGCARRRARVPVVQYFELRRPTTIYGGARFLPPDVLLRRQLAREGYQDLERKSSSLTRRFSSRRWFHRQAPSD